MKKRVVAIVGITLWLAALAGTALAQGTVPPTPIDPSTIPTLPAFLEWLAGPVGWVMLGAFFSFLLARWAWYNAQSTEVKTALPLLLAIIVAGASQALLMYVPVDFWVATAAYWRILAGIVLTWASSQGYYQLRVKPQRKALEAA